MQFEAEHLGLLLLVRGRFSMVKYTERLSYKVWATQYANTSLSVVEAARKDDPLTPSVWKTWLLNGSKSNVNFLPQQIHYPQTRSRDGLGKAAMDRNRVQSVQSEARLPRTWQLPLCRGEANYCVTYPPPASAALLHFSYHV